MARAGVIFAGGEPLPAEAKSCPLLEDLLRGFVGLIEPAFAVARDEHRARMANILYHYSRGADARLERAGSRSADVAHAAMESRAWLRGLYLLALADLDRFGIHPTIQRPRAIRAYDAWWESEGLADDELARGALTVEPHLIARVSRRADLLRGAAWHGRRNDEHRQVLPEGAWAPTPRAVQGASAVCAIWFEAVTGAHREQRRAA